MNEQQTPKKITIALEHVQLDYGREPLGEPPIMLAPVWLPLPPDVIAFPGMTGP